MTPAEQTIANIQQALDVWFRGQSTPIDVLAKITRIINDHEQEKQ